MTTSLAKAFVEMKQKNPFKLNKKLTLPKTMAVLLGENTLW